MEGGIKRLNINTSIEQNLFKKETKNSIDKNTKVWNYQSVWRPCNRSLTSCIKKYKCLELKSITLSLNNSCSNIYLSVVNPKRY